MIKEGIFRKGLVVGIVILFLGAGIIPIISGSIGRTGIIKLKDTPSSMNCYAYGEAWNKESNTVLSQDKVDEIYNMFTELKNKIASDPISDETQTLKIEFVNLLDENGLIQDGYSKDDYLSLLNPCWLNGFQNNDINNVFNELKYAMSHDPQSKITQILKIKFANLLDENGLMPEKMSKADLVSSLNPSLFGNVQNTDKASFSKNKLSSSGPYGNMGISIFCSIASGGMGIVFPFILLPRPRVIALWVASEAATTAANVFTQKGFIAFGPQAGVSLGFMGIGLAFVLPGETLYGFIGYSLLTTVSAYLIEFLPPNNPPVISGVSPSDGAQKIPVSISELSFRIDDADGEHMDYSVTTEPNIGSGSGTNKVNGVYKVPVSGLESYTEYNWNVVVSDGKETVEKQYSFTTEKLEPYITNILPIDNSRNIPLNLSKLTFTIKDDQGDNMDYEVETSPNIGGTSVSGVNNGTYQVAVSGLTYNTQYTWYVNVTDGSHSTNEVFTFKTRLAPGPWWDESWAYRKEIMVDYTKVEGEFNNFPVLISLKTDSDLATDAQDDGDDIAFTDINGNKLNHEIELFNETTGRLVTWVNVENLTLDTIQYMYYGNPNCNSQQNKEATWSSDYVMVHHLQETNGTHYDSTSNNHDTSVVKVTNQNAVGKIAGADDFEADLFDYLEIPYSPDWNFGSNPVTISMWVKMESNRFIMYIWQINSWELYNYYSSNRHFIEYSYSSSEDCIQYDWTYSTGKWYYLTYTRDGDTHSIYIDGELGNSISKGGEPPYSEDVVLIGKVHESEPYWMDGIMDEIRILNAGRSDKWLSTEYKNQNDPSSFVSIGPEVTSP